MHTCSSLPSDAPPIAATYTASISARDSDGSTTTTARHTSATPAGFTSPPTDATLAVVPTVTASVAPHVSPEVMGSLRLREASLVWKTLAHVEARVAASKPGVANSGVLSKRGWPEQAGKG